MSNANILRIWSHVRQVGPLSGDVNGNAWFSLNLAPVFVSDNTAANAVTLQLATQYLQPWTWQWTQMKLRMALLRGGAVIGLIDVPAAQIMTEAPVATITGVFNEEFGINAASLDNFTEPSVIPTSSITMGDGVPRDWRTYLLHASTYPGDIPLRAGLAAWFYVPYNLLGNADEIVVAPVFANNPFSAQLAPVDPPLSTANPPAPCSTVTNPPQPGQPPCPLLRLGTNVGPYAAADSDWVTQWSYAAPHGTDLQAQWIQSRTPLRIPGAAGALPWGNDGFIDEQTLWITPAANSWGQGVNWHDRLEQSVSGLFDLPLRLLEWADKALAQQTPSAIDPNFGQALVASMRDLMHACDDIAGSPNLVRPDGGTLAGDMAAIIAPGPANAAARLQILTSVTTYYAGFDLYNNWVQHLTRVLTGSGPFGPNDLPTGWENPVLNNGTYYDWLKRMHRVRAWLFDPENLRVFIEADWKAALQNTPYAALPNVDQFLLSIDLLSTLRLGFLGVAWNKQTGSWYAPSQITASMTTALTFVYRDRFNLPDPANSPARTPWAYQSLQPRANGVTANQQGDIESYLASFISTWSTSQTGPSPAAGTTPDFSRGNQGINIQFSNFDTVSGADRAYLGSFRGAAVLMRPSNRDAAGNPLYNWSMLNLGQYSVRGDGVDPTAQVAPALNPDQVVVAPTQIVYRNGLRQVTNTYRNQPLSARSPAAALSNNRKLKGTPTLQQADQNYRPGPFQLWNPYRGASPYRLPRLVFGSTYDLAAAAVGLAGELAKEICDPAKPWMVTQTPAAWNPPAAKITTTNPYLRTVPVGLIRVEGQNSRAAGVAISKLTGPPIPDNVYPMIRSLQSTDPNRDTTQQDTVILLADTENIAGANPSGAWIPGATNSMQFFIRPPASDLATFDSWPFNPAPSASDRAAIYSLIARNTDIFNTGDSSQAPDLTLDDPSVTQFSVSLTQQQVPGIPVGPAIPTQSFNVRRPSASSPTLLQQYQSPHIPVTVVVGNAAQLVTPQAATDPYLITVTIPPATVFLLQIAPVPDPTLFAPGACQPAPRNFYIEVASALNVSSLNDAATALNSALQLTLTSPTSSTGTGTDQLQVALSLAGLTAPASNVNLAPQIHRVELMVQRWRWQGRPLVREDQQGNPTLFGFPYTDLKNAGPNSADTVLPPLDGIYFGERDSNDRLVVVAQVDAVSNPASSPVLYTYDLSHSPQALYYRFAVRIFSRYEGLFARGASVESRILRAPSSQIAGPTPEQWRRLLPPCRRTASAPKPAVRLIVPLTRTINDQQTPGLLVVLNEPWYDWAGLAEQLEVQIASVTDPLGNSRLQAGPDPVVSNPDYSAAGAPALIALEANPPAIGPVGFTSDTNTNAPLFAITSFIVPAPRQQNADGTFIPIELSWWLLQLQFRRTLNPDGTAFFGTGLNSDWTAPMQAQLLPAANLWNVTVNGNAARVDTQDLQAVSNGAAGISLLDSNGDQVTVNALPFDSTSTNRFEVWALLMIELQDAFGYSGQEAFVNMVPFASLAALPASGATSLRLVEIQAMNPLSTQRTGWTDLAGDLFPQGSQAPVDPAMARARIVRVSPPILISA
jgi:hypothetical protein